MPEIKPLLNAYIDANIVLVLAFVTWCLARYFINRTRLRRDHLLQLNLTEGLMVAAIISPFVALGLSKLTAMYFPSINLNVSDYAVAQFLDGRVQMRAEDFESLLGLRQRFVTDLVYMQTPLAKAVAGLGLVGLGLGLLRVGVSVWRLSTMIRDSYCWRTFRGLELRLSDQTMVPFSTRGVFKRYVILPSGMLTDPATLRITLAHELQHMRRWDVEWELVLVFLKPFFFWNPVFGRWKRELEHLRELSCDQALIRKQRVQPRAYADCLLKVCRRSVSGEGAFNIVTPRVPLVSLSKTYLGRRNIRVLKDRIREISARQPMRRHSRIALWPVLVVSCVVVALGASSIQRPSDWSQDRLMLSTIVNLERLEQRNSGISLAGF
jgi:hypothetical protein